MKVSIHKLALAFVLIVAMAMLPLAGCTTSSDSSSDDAATDEAKEPIVIGALPGDVMTFRAWAKRRLPAKTSVTIAESDFEKEVDLVLGRQVQGLLSGPNVERLLGGRRGLIFTLTVAG